MQVWLAQDVVVDSPGVDAFRSMRVGFESVIEGFLAQLPQIVLAVILMVVFVLLSRLIAKLLRRALNRTTDRSESFSNVISRLVRVGVVVIGVFIAMIVAVPSLDLAALVASFGLGSVALGFAFSDILQNTLAGLLLLFRQPFQIGDQIEVTEYVGTVEAITIRETQLRQFDGHRILIPNSVVYSSSVRVQTAHPLVRSDVGVGVDYDSDLRKAREVVELAIARVEGVASDPAPEVYFDELNTSTIDMDVRYWTGSRQAEIRAVRDRAIEAITDALNRAGIGMPANIVELDARVSFAEAVMLTQGGTGFGGEQNGQSQVNPLPGLAGSFTPGRTGGTRAYLSDHELDDKYRELARGERARRGGNSDAPDDGGYPPGTDADPAITGESSEEQVPGPQ